MPDYPTPSQFATHIPELAAIELVDRGGQKVVYSADYHGQKVALKLIKLPTQMSSKEEEEEEEEPDVDTVSERAKREFSILEKVNTPVLAKSGPLGFTNLSVGDERWAYFTEEWIEGKSLDQMIRESPLAPESVAQLGVNLTQAVCWLSSQDLIHRDIKPANIKWAIDRSMFVLLDPGIALDLEGPSLTQGPMLVGTMAYLSPEQMDPAQKRYLDFRSDLFTTGVVMYEAACGKHPFKAAGNTLTDIWTAISLSTPQPLFDRIQGFPQALSDFVVRLLGKSPHLRFRTCERAMSAIEEIGATLGVAS